MLGFDPIAAEPIGSSQADEAPPVLPPEGGTTSTVCRRSKVRYTIPPE